MSAARRTAVCLAAAWLAACSSIDARIRDHQAAFDAAPPELQKRIRSGEVDVGFTQEQAAMALGRPDRVYTRKTAAGSREVWAYEVREPGVRLGFGVASFGPSSVIGVDTAVEDVLPGGARLKVVFEGGRVVSVEKRQY